VVTLSSSKNKTRQTYLEWPHHFQLTTFFSKL
jgi:hypothetical protein